MKFKHRSTLLVSLIPHLPILIKIMKLNQFVPLSRLETPPLLSKSHFSIDQLIFRFHRWKLKVLLFRVPALKSSPYLFHSLLRRIARISSLTLSLKLPNSLIEVLLRISSPTVRLKQKDSSNLEIKSRKRLLSVI